MKGLSEGLVEEECRKGDKAKQKLNAVTGHNELILCGIVQGYLFLALLSRGAR